MALSKMKFLDMHDDGLEKVMDYVDLVSKIKLRKVSHGMRNFMNRSKQGSKLTAIQITCMQSNNWNVMIRTAELEQTVYYRKEEGNGCAVGIMRGERGTLLPNSDNFEIFMNDLKSNLNHQKSVLEEFKVSFRNYDLADQFYNGFREMMEARGTLRLKVRKLNLAVRSTNHALSILPYLDPEFLERIDISSNMGGLDASEVLNLEQISHLKELFINGMTVSVPLAKLLHVKNMAIQLPMISLEHVKLLKEAFMSTPHLGTYYIIASGFVDLPQILEYLGPPLAPESENQSVTMWQEPTPDNMIFNFDMLIPTADAPHIPPYIRCNRYVR